MMFRVFLGVCQMLRNFLDDVFPHHCLKKHPFRGVFLRIFRGILRYLERSGGWCSRGSCSDSCVVVVHFLPRGSGDGGFCIDVVCPVLGATKIAAFGCFFVKRNRQIMQGGFAVGLR